MSHSHDLFEPNDCNDTYDHERTAGSVLFFAGEIELPHDWKADQAVIDELSHEWHEPVVASMKLERRADENDIHSYPKRQAILTLEIFETSPWPLACRRGTAYGVMILGMWGHHFVPRPGGGVAMHKIQTPKSDFFEDFITNGGVDALAGLLTDAYIHETELRSGIGLLRSGPHDQRDGDAPLA